MYSIKLAIDCLLLRTNMDIYKLAEASGIDVTQLYRWRDREDFSMTPVQMILLARAFFPKGSDFVEAHATLLHGYLGDQCRGPGAGKIYLDKIPFSDWLITTSFGAISLPRGLKRDLEAIHNVVWRNREVRKRIRLVAKFCREEALKKEQAKI